MKETKPTSPVVKSADRVLDILELFAEETDGLSLMDITRKLKLPASSAYKIMQNLLVREYVETDSHGKIFRLGPKVFEIGTRYVKNTNLTIEFHQIASRIVEELNEAVFLSIRSEDKTLYIAEKQSTHHVRFVSHLGMKLPLYATAMGKMLLSSLPSETIREMYGNKPLEAMTEYTITDYKQLEQQLETIRIEGISISEEETVVGIRCVAAPIYNAKDEMIASMSISIPTARLTDELWNRAVSWARKGARQLSMVMFYQS